MLETINAIKIALAKHLNLRIDYSDGIRILDDVPDGNYDIVVNGEATKIRIDDMKIYIK